MLRFGVGKVWQLRWVLASRSLDLLPDQAPASRHLTALYSAVWVGGTEPRLHLVSALTGDDRFRDGHATQVTPGPDKGRSA